MMREHVQRRLAAVVAADVVAYSRLVGRDEVGTIARLKRLKRELVHPAVRSHDGRVVRWNGDGLLVEFASAIEAILCVVGVQCAIIRGNHELPEDERILFRVGINLGDLIVDTDDIFGETVNVAARLEALSPPGGLAFSRAMHEQVRDRVPFEFENLGELQVKNIARALHVYAVRCETLASVDLPPVDLPLQSRNEYLTALVRSTSHLTGLHLPMKAISHWRQGRHAEQGRVVRVPS